MGEYVSYNSKDLGRFKVDNNGKVFFVAENLESLTILFGIKPGNMVKTEGRGEIIFEVFKEDYLDKVSAFYPTVDEYLLRGCLGRTVEQFEKLRQR